MKHERAIVMGLAYFIGFTTSFIGYGLVTGNEYEAPFVAVSAPTQMASLAAIPAAKDTVLAFSATPTQENATDDLYVSLGNEKRLVSTSYNNAPELENNAHVSLSKVIVNPETRRVFFCRTTFGVSESCDPFIYDWATNTNYPLFTNGTVATLSTTDLDARWNADGSLLLNNKNSLSTQSPWQF